MLLADLTNNLGVAEAVIAAVSLIRTTPLASIRIAGVALFKLSVAPPVVVPALRIKSILLFPPPLSHATTSLSPPDSYPKYPTPLPEECVTSNASPPLTPSAPISTNLV